MTERLSTDYRAVFEQETDLQEYLNAPVPLKGGSSASALDLLMRFAESEFGQHMATEQDLRYSQRFGFDRDRMLEYLGGDVNPLGHMHHTAILSAKILKAQVDKTGQLPIPEEKVGTLIFTDGRHDTGESIHRFVAEKTPVVGDIPAGNKIHQNRIDEANVRKFFREDREYAIWEDVADEAWIEGEDDIEHRDRETSTHRVSQTSHDIGTHGVSIDAGSAYQKLKQDPNTDPHVLRQLERLRRIVAPCVEEAIGQAGVYLVYANDYAMQHGIYVPPSDISAA
jgi:hypothetical protein